MLRSLKLGDAWRYEVSGDLASPESGPRALRGSIVVSVGPDTLSGVQGGFTLSFLQRLQVKDAEGLLQVLPAPDWMFSFVQDAVTKDASIVADNMGRGGACRLAAVPQLFYPGQWSGVTRYANQLEFGGGDFVRNTLTVTGQERVKTPAGVFWSWVAEITSESPAMGQITGIDWWTPELGAPAQFETAAMMTDGARMRLLATLTSTTVVPDEAGSFELGPR